MVWITEYDLQFSEESLLQFINGTSIMGACFSLRAAPLVLNHFIKYGEINTKITTTKKEITVHSRSGVKDGEGGPSRLKIIITGGLLERNLLGKNMFLLRKLKKVHQQTYNSVQQHYY